MSGMNAVEWKRLRQVLLVLVPGLIVVGWSAVMLWIIGTNYMVTAGMSPIRPELSRPAVCGSGAQPRLATMGGHTWVDVVMVILAIAVGIFAWWLARRVPRGELRLAARIVVVLAVVVFAWAMVNAYIDFKDGLVWFAPRCGQGPA